MDESERPYVFVGISSGPFEPLFRVVERAVKESLGLPCVTGQNLPPTASSIKEALQTRIEGAELVIIDCSRPGPWYMWELGVAEGLQKPVVLITKLQVSKDKITFLPPAGFVTYGELEQPSEAQDFAVRLGQRLESLWTARGTLAEGIGSEIALSGYEEGPVKVEDYANLLRDLVFLHDHLWIAASEEGRNYDLSAGYFYTRHGRPVPDSQRLLLKQARIGSPFDLRIIIPSATVLASIAVTYYQLLQAHRTRKLLPGELRRQALDEEKIRRELDTTAPRENLEGPHLAPQPDDNRHLRQVLSGLPGFAGEKGETIARVVQRDLDRISSSPIKITEVVVVRTVETKDSGGEKF